MPKMFKRKIQISIVVILALLFLGTLVGTFSQPAPANIRMTFAGYTTVPWPIGFQNGGFQFTNASFFVSNAGTAKVRLTFRDYEFNNGDDSMILIRPSGLGILCSLKPGQSTNLIVPMIPNIHRLGSFNPDYSWRVEFTTRNDWLGKLDRQPKWLQTAVTKLVPNHWMADLCRADVVSNWVTNREPTPDSLKMLKSSPFTNTNSEAP
jgi:hypothetical protein